MSLRYLKVVRRDGCFGNRYVPEVISAIPVPFKYGFVILYYL